MQKKDSTVRTILIMEFAALLGVFLLSVPIAYWDVARARAGNEIGFLYLALRAARFLAALALGWALRKRNAAALAEREPACRRVTAVVAGCALLGVLPFLRDAGAQLYATVQFGCLLVPPVSALRLLVAVLWEQFFAGDLFWCALICTATVFTRIKIPRAADRPSAAAPNRFQK